MDEVLDAGSVRLRGTTTGAGAFEAATATGIESIDLRTDEAVGPITFLGIPGVRRLEGSSYALGGASYVRYDAFPQFWVSTPASDPTQAPAVVMRALRTELENVVSTGGGGYSADFDLAGAAEAVGGPDPREAGFAEYVPARVTLTPDGELRSFAIRLELQGSTLEIASTVLDTDVPVRGEAPDPADVIEMEQFLPILQRAIAKGDVR